MVFDPRFGYSEHAPRFEVSAEGVLAIGPNGERYDHVTLYHELGRPSRPFAGHDAVTSTL